MNCQPKLYGHCMFAFVAAWNLCVTQAYRGAAPGCRTVGARCTFTGMIGASPRQLIVAAFRMPRRHLVCIGASIGRVPISDAVQVYQFERLTRPQWHTCLSHAIPSARTTGHGRRKGLLGRDQSSTPALISTRRVVERRFDMSHITRVLHQ
jgi:hypothetical protein